MLKSAGLLVLLTLTIGCGQEYKKPPPPNTIALQYNEMALHPSVLEWKVKEAEIDVQLSFGAIERMQADLDKASNEWKRDQILHCKKAISDVDYDIGCDNYVIAKQALVGAKLTYEQNQYKLAEAKSLLEVSREHEKYYK